MSEFKDFAYILGYEVNHFQDYGLDWSFDLEIIKFDDLWKCEVSESELFEHPNPIIYKGYWDVVKYIDYPHTDNYWSVMSKKMYETLLSVGNFPHRLIPMVVIDWQIQPWDWFEEGAITRDNAYQVDQSEWYKMGKNLRKDVIHDDFVLIQLTEHLDILDYDKSVIEYDEDNPREIRNVEKYFLKFSENLLPPLFRIKNSSFDLFVSKEARSALRNANISGIEYISPSGFPGGGEPTIDVPIVLPA